MKITTLAHPVFLWLRRKVFEVIPWMLLSSVGVLQLEHHILYKQPKRVSELFKERSTILECHWMSGELTEILLFPSKNGHLGSLCHRHPHLHGLAHHALGRPAKKASQSVSGSHTPAPGHTPRLSWLSSPLPPLFCHRRSAPQAFPRLRTGCAGSDLSAHSGPFHPTVSSPQAESFPGQGPS